MTYSRSVALDLDTLRIAQVAVAATALFLVLFGTYRITRADFAGWWVWVLVLSSLSSVCYFADAEPVRNYAAALGNAFGGAAGAAIWMAARTLRQRSTPWWLYVGPAVLTAIATLLAHPTGDAWPGGFVLLAALAILVGASGVELLALYRAPRDTRGADWRNDVSAAIVAMALTSIVASMFYAYRVVVYFVAGPSSAFYQSWAGPLATTFMVIIVIVVVTYGVAELSRYELAHEWRQRALHDDLTGLLNRNAFTSRASMELAAVDAGHEPVVVLADFDHFKRVNDKYGHRVGDEVLVAYGNAVRGALRGHDLACRIGGEEFVLLVADGGERAARRVISAIADEFARNLDYAGELPTISYGVALVGDESVEDAIERADRAMYAAKRSGRDTIVVAKD